MIIVLAIRAIYLRRFRDRKTVCSTQYVVAGYWIQIAAIMIVAHRTIICEYHRPPLVALVDDCYSSRRDALFSFPMRKR